MKQTERVQTASYMSALYIQIIGSCCYQDFNAIEVEVRNWNIEDVLKGVKDRNSGVYGKVFTVVQELFIAHSNRFS